MNSISKDELFTHVQQFLKSKGVDLQEGSYTRTIQKGCQVLADTINLSQQAVGRAKTEVERKLEQVRQTIHDKTAPKASDSPVTPETTAAAEAPPPPATATATATPNAAVRRLKPKKTSRKAGLPKRPKRKSA